MLNKEIMIGWKNPVNSWEMDRIREEGVVIEIPIDRDKLKKLVIKKAPEQTNP